MTEAEIAGALRVLQAVADAIRELGTVSTGRLYGTLIPVMTLERFNQIIGLLVKSGVVTKNGEQLTWVG